MMLPTKQTITAPTRRMAAVKASALIFFILFTLFLYIIEALPFHIPCLFFVIRRTHLTASYQSTDAAAIPNASRNCVTERTDSFRNPLNGVYNIRRSPANLSLIHI